MIKKYLNKIICGDCLEVMKGIPDKSVDMILCDLPYGTTACKWDTIIPFEPLWEAYKRIIKDNGAIVLTAQQPFASALIMSNIKWFKYEWVWEKDAGANFANVNYQPFRVHENILIFGKFATSFNRKRDKNYNPQMTSGKPYSIISGKQKHDTLHNGSAKDGEHQTINSGTRHPRSVIKINKDNIKLHPTQKPVALFEYLIKTYTNEGELVLDNCIGSGTTAVACKNLKRNFIGIEISEDYCKIARDRLKQQILL